MDVGLNRSLELGCSDSMLFDISCLRLLVRNILVHLRRALSSEFTPIQHYPLVYCKDGFCLSRRASSSVRTRIHPSPTNSHATSLTDTACLPAPTSASSCASSPGDDVLKSRLTHLDAVGLSTEGGAEEEDDLLEEAFSPTGRQSTEGCAQLCPMFVLWQAPDAQYTLRVLRCMYAQVSKLSL